MAQRSPPTRTPPGHRCHNAPLVPNQFPAHGHRGDRVCLGVARAELVVGIIVAVVVMPALVYTVIMVKKRSTRERPMAVADKVIAFIVAIGGVIIVEFSAVVAFCMTCYPIGAVSFSANGRAQGVILRYPQEGSRPSPPRCTRLTCRFQERPNWRNPGKP